MREILFRGKRVDNGEWVEGAYYKQTEFYGDEMGRLLIITTKDELVDNMMDFYRVDPETVGQYIGLTDKNGKKIFEGDIVKGYWNTIMTVFYDDVACSFRVKTMTGSEREPSYYYNESKPLEIIGNVHDNPEKVK